MQRDSLFYYEPRVISKSLSIISIPTELGSDARGLAETPAYLKKHGLERMLAALDVDLAEQIDIPCPHAPAPSMGRLKNLAQVAEVARASAQTCATAAQSGAVLALGGDHSISIGTIAGASRAHESLGVIWIDAHPDVHTHETTVTHNLHNMGAALAMGMGHDELLSERRAVDPSNFLFIGIKDLSFGDRGEIDFLRAHQPPHFTMLDIVRDGLAPIFNSIDALARKVDKVWISMDIDSIDREFAPGVAMQNEGGLTRREILALAQYIGHTCDIVGLDIVEMVPAKDIENKTAKLALELIARFFGGEWSWYSDYMDTYEKINTAAEEKIAVENKNRRS